MPTIKEVLIKLGEAKAKRKDLRLLLKGVLAESQAYRQADEQLTQLKLKRSGIEADILGSTHRSEQENLEKLKKEIDDYTALLSDLALSMFMKGENIEVETDTAKFEPKFKVTFSRQMKLF